MCVMLLYGCESWTLTVTSDLVTRIQAFENNCYRRVLGISYREPKTNAYVWQQVITPSRPSGASAVHRQASQVIMVRPRLSPWHTANDQSYYRAPWTEGVAEVDRVNRGRTTPGSGRVGRCHHCSALQMIVVDGRPSYRMHLSGYPNDAWASRVLTD